MTGLAESGQAVRLSDCLIDHDPVLSDSPAVTGCLSICNKYDFFTTGRP